MSLGTGRSVMHEDTREAHGCITPRRGYTTISATSATRSPCLFWRLQAGVWLTFGGAMSIGRVGEWPLVWIVVLEWPFAALGFLTTLLVGGAYGRLRLGRESLPRTVGATLLVSYAGALLWTATYHTYQRVTPSIVQFWTGERVGFEPGPLLDNAVFHTFVLLAWSALFFWMESYGRMQEERERALRAEARASEAQLQMLAYQLNPHFLFNALNSVRAMIDEDRDGARRMVTELALFLRYTLVERPLRTARLSEELAVIRGYLDIEQIRFEERLAVEIDVEPAAEDLEVPAFLLHPLVENALKHGDPLREGEPLRLRIAAGTVGDRLRVVVDNTGTLAPPGPGPGPSRSSVAAAEPGTASVGTGLRNVRERLRQLFPETHRFALEEREGWVAATIEIPKVTSGAESQPPIPTVGSDALEPHNVSIRE